MARFAHFISTAFTIQVAESTCITRLFRSLSCFSHFNLTALTLQAAESKCITQFFCSFSTAISPNTSNPRETKTFSHMFQECAAINVLNPGKQAHGRMISSGFMPSLFVSNCLIQMYVRTSSLEYALNVFDKMPRRDNVSWNTLLFGNAVYHNMKAAQEFFDLMPQRDNISWNSLISGYLQKGEYERCFELLSEMSLSGILFDKTTLSLVLKACSSLENCIMGVQIHRVAVRCGLDRDMVVGTALVDMYAKCKDLGYSLKFFSGMIEKNWVSWSTAIAGCVQNDDLKRSFELFIEMQRGRVENNQSTYASLLRACAGLSCFKLGIQFHAHSLKTKFTSDVIVGTATLDMYAKCGNLSDARKFFTHMPHHNLQAFNASIVGYARGGYDAEALWLFVSLQKSGLRYDDITLSGTLSACAVNKDLISGIQIHGLSIKSGLWLNSCVRNAVLDMYGKCGALSQAKDVFGSMTERDSVSWNAVIAANEQNGDEEETLQLFSSMLRSSMEPDEFTFGSVIKACAGKQNIQHGLEAHNRIIKSGMGFGTFVGSTLVDMYCKCGMIEEAEKLHRRIEEQTPVSWNAMISGFSLQKEDERAQKFFLDMLQTGLRPDNFTFATVLDTCANLATLELGKQIHGRIIKEELQSDVYVASTLVDMYSKCGNMHESQLAFERSHKRDFVTWNLVIYGYAQHGLGEEALKIFDRMQVENVKPNHASFTAVLRACGHIGLVEKGWHYFNLMSSKYGLEPQLVHYSCMVDIVGRSGQIEEALKLIEEMPFEADDVIWKTLLSVCKMHKNVSVAEKAAAAIIQKDPQDSAAYILLSNIYAELKMWDGVSNMRRMMKLHGTKKMPGCSWIEVMNEVHTFLADDGSHSRREEIYDLLGVLIDDMSQSGYVPDADVLLHDEVAELYVVEEGFSYT